MSAKFSIMAARLSVIAAVYAALTIALGPLAYGEIQVRISDAMLILPFLAGFGWDAVVGLTIGGFLANLASPFGYIDWVFGPIANFLAALGVYASKKIFGENIVGLVIGEILAIIAITLVIGYGELYLVFGIPWMVIIYVLIGEVISIGIGGTIIYGAFKRLRG
ncbi:QueT transporter family protein [Staphylothermus hellenicus]|uniref:QueT transporter n=1 Tax=Staphylothermus hellenicus (strain DSM 12710 / JCM 10830 / BK20S6-10-b1 / P8) TaxID=591019 RepID=D7DBJ6_STAHD|nr:QueT transporter family protein [Staphylothermus hellenicus]ADI31543.1 protein of unknown function DUF988 [Staphylothermus hellenicus DSM 12710]